MIIRAANDSLLLITQPDHAALAGAVMAAWQRERMIDARRDQILLAVAEHDNGWQEEDAAPQIDPANGRILDFMTAPDAVRQRVWPRAMRRLASTPYAAALVGHHAVTVYDRFRSTPEWASFFNQMAGLRDEALEQATPLSFETLQQDYFFVRIGDLISLMFCNEWHAPQQFGGYELRLDGPRLTITPDPFDRREVLLSIAARQVPDQPYRSAADAAAAFASAPVMTVTGVALGPS